MAHSRWYEEKKELRNGEPPVSRLGSSSGNSGVPSPPRREADGARPTHHGGEVSPQAEGFGMVGNRAALAEIGGSGRSVLDRGDENGFDRTSWRIRRPRRLGRRTGLFRI